MTTTDPTFDAFEQRLADALTTRAATLTGPPDGLERIHARVTHRRRTRRGAWLAAAACLVVVAGTIGITLRSTDQDSTPYVDTGDDTGGLPLLGFDNDTWVVTSYTPGWGYGLISDMSLPSNEALVAIVSRTDQEAAGREWVDGAIEDINGIDAMYGTLLTRAPDREITGFSQAVWWDVAPGYRITVTTNEAIGDPEDGDLVLAAAREIVEADRFDWEDHLRSEARGPRPSDLPMLVLAPAAGTTALVNVSGDAAYAWLTPTDRDGGVQLGALAPGVEFGSDDGPSTPVSVRGTQGRFLPGPSPGPMLLWEEGGRTYFLMNVQLEDGPALAEQLVMPDAESWRRLLFPSEPTTLPDGLVPSGT